MYTSTTNKRNNWPLLVLTQRLSNKLKSHRGRARKDLSLHTWAYCHAIDTWARMKRVALLRTRRDLLQHRLRITEYYVHYIFVTFRTTNVYRVRESMKRGWPNNSRAYNTCWLNGEHNPILAHPKKQIH